MPSYKDYNAEGENQQTGVLHLLLYFSLTFFLLQILETSILLVITCSTCDHLFEVITIAFKTKIFEKEYYSDGMCLFQNSTLSFYE